MNTLLIRCTRNVLLSMFAFGKRISVILLCINGVNGSRGAIKLPGKAAVIKDFLWLTCHNFQDSLTLLMFSNNEQERNIPQVYSYFITYRINLFPSGIFGFVFGKSMFIIFFHNLAALYLKENFEWFNLQTQILPHPQYFFENGIRARLRLYRL